LPNKPALATLDSTRQSPKAIKDRLRFLIRLTPVNSDCGKFEEILQSMLPRSTTRCRKFLIKHPSPPLCAFMHSHFGQRVCWLNPKGLSILLAHSPSKTPVN
jgi:hypothetical protein